MNTQTLLTELDQRGITLTLTPTSLRYQAPPGAMTPALRSALVANKLEVRRLLQDAPGGETPGKRGDSTATPARDAQGAPSPTVATVSAEIAARAEALLSRMAEGDVVAARFYADLAEAMGWPVYGRGVAGWGEWAGEVQDGSREPLPRRV